MIVKTNTSDKLVLEERTMALAVFLVCSVLILAYGGFAYLNQTWILSPWVCFMGATLTYLICRAFIHRTVIKMDVETDTITVITSKFDGTSTQSYPLSNLYCAVLQVMEDDKLNLKAYRIGLKLGANHGAEVRPVTKSFASNATTQTAAAAINGWLARRVDSGLVAA